MDIKYEVLKFNLKTPDKEQVKKIIQSNLSYMFISIIVVLVFIAAWKAEGLPSPSYVGLSLSILLMLAIQTINIIKLKKKGSSVLLVSEEIIIEKSADSGNVYFSLKRKSQLMSEYFAVLHISKLIKKNVSVKIIGRIEVVTRYTDEMINDELEYKKRLRIVTTSENINKIYAYLLKLKDQTAEKQ